MFFHLNFQPNFVCSKSIVSVPIQQNFFKNAESYDNIPIY